MSRISDSNRVQRPAKKLNQEHMMQMMALPTSPMRKTGTVAVKENVQEISEEPHVSTPSESTSREAPPNKKNADESKEQKREKSANASEEYEAAFIKSGESNVRNGKAIYIRADFHLRISRIVQTIGGGEVSLTDYVDNVFAHHFKEFEQEIKKSFNKYNKPIF